MNALTVTIPNSVSYIVCPIFLITSVMLFACLVLLITELVFIRLQKMTCSLLSERDSK